VNGGLTVRPARPIEFDEVGRLTVDAYRAGGLPNSASSYVTKLADAAGRAEHAELLVAADHGGALLGTVTVCAPGSALGEVSRPGELEFRMLGVAPAARGRGIGRALVQAVIGRANDVGAYRVVMCSLETARAAHRLYDRLGFVRLPERDWYPEPDVLLMAFALDLPGR
jgi:ribosomal protein S18 acetylase RimI-like enzyme